MKTITIVTPEQQEEERTKCLLKAVELLEKQSRSAARYAKRIKWHLNRARELGLKL